MYMLPESASVEHPRPSFNAGIVVFASAAFTLALGILPARILQISGEAIRSLLRP
jgi:NADH:ubiquinone oxidoreductase subunit 2 (subunit N)